MLFQIPLTTSTFQILMVLLTWFNLFEEKVKVLMFCFIAQVDNQTQQKE